MSQLNHLNLHLDHLVAMDESVQSHQVKLELFTTTHLNNLPSTYNNSRLRYSSNKHNNLILLRQNNKGYSNIIELRQQGDNSQGD